MFNDPTMTLTISKEDNWYEIYDENEELIHDCEELEEAILWAVQVCKSEENEYNKIEIDWEEW